MGHGVEAIAITVIVLFAVILGFIQEFRAERAIEALREMAAPSATVIRDGRDRRVPARDLVPGDLIVLSTGDKVPADSRLTEAVNLQTVEAALTGESAPVEKHSNPLHEATLPTGDQRNMAFAGTAVTYGRGRALVVATGMSTEFGKIARMLEEVDTAKTPLQKNLDRIGKSLARAAFAVVFVIVALGLFRGQPFVEMLIFGVALAVAVVPEALPAVVTISLALGVKRMVRRNALIRRLPAVETLGSTSVICSDKTGTLTKDEMTVRQLYVAEAHPRREDQERRLREGRVAKRRVRLAKAHRYPVSHVGQPDRRCCAGDEQSLHHDLPGQRAGQRRVLSRKEQSDGEEEREEKREDVGPKHEATEHEARQR